MPQPPSVDFITRYFFENSWPGAILLCLAGAIAAIAWRRTAKRGPAIAAVACVGAAGALVVLAMAVVTSGERARQVTIDLVDAATAGNVAAARAQFHDGATMSFAAADNPPESIDFIQQSLEQLRGRYSIADNQVTHLRGYSIAHDRAEVHLRVITRLEGHPYTIPTSWTLSIARQDDGGWKIEHITFIDYAGQAPGRNVFR